MLQSAYFLAKIGADTAENEQHFAEILPKIGNCAGPGQQRAAAPGARPGVSSGSVALNLRGPFLTRFLRQVVADRPSLLVKRYPVVITGRKIGP